MIEKLAPQILEEIKKAQNILLHCHPSADADSVGGALAMMHVLEGMDKKVTVIRGDSEISQGFAILPGIKKILPKNFFEIDLAQFDLFIIQDSASLDRISCIAPVVFPASLKTINIDHHITNKNFAEINLVEATYPATCQVLYDLFVAWNVAITPEIAKCLMLGMYSDTGGFSFQNTKSSTLASAADLAKIAPDFTSTLSYMDNSNTPGVIAFEALALSSVTLHCHNSVAISAVSYDALQEKKIKKEEIFVGIANTLKSVIGWEIGVKMVEDEPNKVKASFRTRDSGKYDVSKIAAALGGGGHKDASGATLKTSLNEAVKKVVETIGSIYPDLKE